MENNSKQAVLSIVGIAVLVIAVVGVSFAFFTYSKGGSTNNVITAGNIVFEFTEGTNGLALTNQFPQSADEAKLNNATFDFSVSGTLPTTMKHINYRVYAIKGDLPADHTEANRLKDSEVSLYLTTTGGTITAGYGTDGAPATGVTAGTATAGTGLQVANGTIEATGSEVKDTYSITMWVNNTVTISDTETATYRASASATANTTKPIYSDTFYSFKIRVDAEG